MVKYVCGFAFNKKRTHVLLIKKQKPEWQAGKLNGIGGKINKDETPSHAMVREFNEEVGIKTVIEDWKPMLALTDEYTWIVYFYKSILDIDVARQREIEEPVIINVSTLHLFPVIPNLLWLIPMALDKDTKIVFSGKF